jgi:hypothetical protein
MLFPTKKPLTAHTDDELEKRREAQEKRKNRFSLSISAAGAALGLGAVAAGVAALPAAAPIGLALMAKLAGPFIGGVLGGLAGYGVAEAATKELDGDIDSIDQEISRRSTPSAPERPAAKSLRPLNEKRLRDTDIDFEANHASLPYGRPYNPFNNRR